jgi:hypothetical protein
MDFMTENKKDRPKTTVFFFNYARTLTPDPPFTIHY